MIKKYFQLHPKIKYLVSSHLILKVGTYNKRHPVIYECIIFIMSLSN